MGHQRKIAILGAGLAGLTLAQRLSGAAEVAVFEKSRGMGGRMSTRRAERFAFDHGAQYFTAKGDGFRRFLNPFMASGLVREWTPKVAALGAGTGSEVSSDRHQWLVAQPGMNSLCKRLGDDLDVRLSAEVAGLEREGQSWRIGFKDGSMEEGFDLVLSTAPAPQTRRIFPSEFSGESALLQSKMSGCYSLMLGFVGQDGPAWDVARTVGSPLAWIAVNSRKPGRKTDLSILCQSSNSWTEDNLERDQDAVREDLLATFRDLTGMAATPDYISLHRWRFANVDAAAGISCLFDGSLGLGAAGDWCGAGRVEAAFDSGAALASAVLAELAVAG